MPTLPTAKAAATRCLQECLELRAVATAAAGVDDVRDLTAAERVARLISGPSAPLAKAQDTFRQQVVSKWLGSGTEGSLAVLAQSALKVVEEKLSSHISKGDFGESAALLEEGGGGGPAAVVSLEAAAAGLGKAALGELGSKLSHALNVVAQTDSRLSPKQGDGGRSQAQAPASSNRAGRRKAWAHAATAYKKYSELYSCVAQLAGITAELPLMQLKELATLPQEQQLIYTTEGADVTPTQRAEALAARQWGNWRSLLAESGGLPKRGVNYANTYYSRHLECLRAALEARRGNGAGALGTLHRRMRKRADDLPTQLQPGPLAGLGSSLLQEARANLTEAQRGIEVAKTLFCKCSRQFRIATEHEHVWRHA